MENIRSSNVYLKMSLDSVKNDENENEEKAPASEDVDDVSTNRERKRKLPHWTRLASDDEKVKYADWTLDVTLSNNNYDDDGTGAVVVSYSVHKCLIGLQSEYFDGIFRVEGGFSESHQKRSTIKLHTPTVTIHHFEHLLDYLYTGKLVMNSENAVSMVYFGDYFGINLLQEQAQSFIQEIIATKIYSVEVVLKLTNIYHGAKILTMEELQEAIVYECAGKPVVLKKSTTPRELSVILDKQFWYRVWAARKFHPVTELLTKQWSINVAHFIGLHYADIVDQECFYELTQKNELPIISYKSAIYLMEQDHRMCAAKKTVIQNKDVKNLTCLQQRCIDALFDNENGQWKVANPHNFFKGRLQNLPPTVVETLMLHAMDGKKKPSECFDSIEVSGAGSEFVNGVYTKTGLHERYPIFTRSAIYNGNNESFCIYRCSDIQSCISIVPFGCIPGRNDSIYFYDKLTAVEGLFTDEYWEPCNEGQSPAPILRYIND